MDFCEAFVWIEQTPVAEALRSSRVLFPLVEITHLVGLALFAGPLVLINMALLGRAMRRQPDRGIRPCALALDPERYRSAASHRTSNVYRASHQMVRQPRFLVQNGVINDGPRFSMARSSQGPVRKCIATASRKAHRRRVLVTLDQYRSFGQDHGVLLRPIAIALLLLSSQQIETRLHQLRQLSDVERVKVTRQLALEIRQLPATAKKGAARRASCRLGDRRRSRSRHFAGSCNDIGGSIAPAAGRIRLHDSGGVSAL